MIERLALKDAIIDGFEGGELESESDEIDQERKIYASNEWDLDFYQRKLCWINEI